MSGQLVGEVIDAAEAGHLDDLSANAFAALIVIADRAHTGSRQGSVRAARIAAAIRRPNAPWCTTTAGSQSTVERAIRELKAAGRISVVKRGFNNAHGRAQAPVYQVAPFPSSMVTETVNTVPVISATVPVISATVPVTQGDDLTVFLDGPTDGGSARETRPTAEDPPHALDAPPEDEPEKLADAALADAAPLAEPPRRCPRHVNWDPNRDGPIGKCGPCGDYREAHKVWSRQAEEADVKAAANAKQHQTTLRKLIDDCRDCDESGRRDDQSDCPNHSNFRQVRVS